MTDFLRRIDKSWTLFLDRDGVINQRIVGGYVARVSEFNFPPGVLESMSSFATIFGRVVVVTNQQGIGKGLMTHHQLSEVHKFMITEIEASGGRIDAVYYCSDLASDDNSCRKPSPFMANQARLDFPEIDFSKSIMVGDSVSDMEFGKACGMKTVFVQHDKSKGEIVADVCVSGLPELVRLIDV